jgi:hypothetical protein
MIFTPLRRVGLALIILFVAFAVWELGSIYLRLSRNLPIAKELVESLNQRFPGVTFSGTASYEREVIYVTVDLGIDAKQRQEVEQWLRVPKREKAIKAEIWLSFRDDEDMKSIKF